jgi:HIRAN domain
MEIIVALAFVAVIVVCYVIAKAMKGRQPTKAPQTAAPHITAPSQTTALAHSGKSYPFSEVTNDVNFPHVRSIHTKIRGVTKENPDGASRQQIISQCCRSGNALFLVREPNNPVDPNAIQVRRIVYSDVPEDKPRLGEQLGYVSHELADDIAPKMDHDGFVLMAWIMNVTGGEDKESLGVNIQIEEYRPAKHHAPSRRKRATRINRH